MTYKSELNLSIHNLLKGQPIKQDAWHLNCLSEPFEPKLRRDLSLLLNPSGSFRIQPEYTSRNLICLKRNHKECKKPPGRCKQRYSVCQSGEKMILCYFLSTQNILFRFK